ncbi:cytochrome c oxidase subunit 7A1, mitochondrial [Teleopsis dalmanni]|uniref:cytochrome c oxidase subunit 7A1, mitochondrial n=1 Tax=Teleopsis dalmanni TaxID=139649 RepID=UPI0018CF739B|nr:cytochrome c oxidase subunit 7A1, mitochondrial [Teleopsis dalmanni]XP_037927791.1 cytochrome c oxidase subunit 7A1, mitochondrial [Teleopsis dalmanni]
MALQEAFEKNLKKFQAKNDLPVFLKGGPADKILFGITIACCGLGLMGIVQMAYQMGFKKK